MEKLRVAELIADSKLVEKQKAAEYQGDTFRLQAELAKAQAKLKVFHKTEEE